MKNDYDAPEMEIGDDIYESDGLRWMSVLVVILVVCGFFSLAWYAYRTNTGSSVAEDEVMLVEAPDGEYRSRPDDPGGAEFLHKDKEVYNRLVARNPEAAGNVERLMPGAEEPVVERVVSAGETTKSWVNRDINTPSDADRFPQVEKSVSSQAGEASSVIAQSTHKAVQESQQSIPKPQMKPVPGVAPKPRPKEKSVAAGSAAGSMKVQLAALRSRQEAQTMWSRLSARHRDLLGGKKYQVVRADIAGKGTFYRLRVYCRFP